MLRYSVMHSHPKKLNGTKFFTWGFAEHGTFQQDFMSASDYTNANCSQDYYDPWCTAYEHEGMYSELQIGPALTQRHTFALPANSSFEWTEWFQGWQADPKEMHAPDYSRGRSPPPTRGGPRPTRRRRRRSTTPTRSSRSSPTCRRRPTRSCTRACRGVASTSS